MYWQLLLPFYISIYNTLDAEDLRVCSLQLEEWRLLELIQNKDPISAKYGIIIIYIYLTGYNDTNMTKFTYWIIYKEHRKEEK
jgi:hypothetical protein